MSRLRSILGLVAGVMLVASAGAHSLLGGVALVQELAPFNVAADVLQGVQVGWHFGGACMLAFGVIVISTFAQRLRGAATPTTPVLVIGLAYLGFAAWAVSQNGFDPFYLVFVVPGVLLVFAAS